MSIPIDDDLRRIARSIVQEGRSLEEWAAVDSDDMFQEGRYAGGFDADEGEFCFSYSGPEGELWFQMPLATVEELAAGSNPVIAGRTRS